MSIFRTKKIDNPFVQIDKFCLRDKRLSLKAKGLLCYMLSMPDDWKFYETELAEHCADGSTALKSAFEELQNAGYVVKRRLRNEKGRIVAHETIVYERPERAYKI